MDKNHTFPSPDAVSAFRVARDVNAAIDVLEAAGLTLNDSSENEDRHIGHLLFEATGLAMDIVMRDAKRHYVLDQETRQALWDAITDLLSETSRDASDEEVAERLRDIAERTAKRT